MKKLALLALVAFLASVPGAVLWQIGSILPARAQQQIPVMPPGTVWGRLSSAGTYGPGAAIPISTLSPLLPPGNLTPGLPLIGNGTAPIITGSKSGSTTNFATTNGGIINGDCASFDSNGNVVDAGGPCTTGGGGGTVTAGLAGQIAFYPANGSTVVGVSPPTAGLRQVLAAPLTLYANASASVTAPCGANTCQPGSDSNNCLSFASPCQTLQHALNVATNNYDFGPYTVVVQLADGTYNECIGLPNYVAVGTTGRPATIQGHHGNPALTTVTCGSGNTIVAVNVQNGWILRDLFLSGAGACIFVDYHAAVYWDGGTFGPCTNFHVQIVNVGAFFELINNNFTIAGNSQTFLAVVDGGEVISQGVTANIVGALTFSAGFVTVGTGGIADLQFLSFGGSGSVTGTKFVLGTTPPSDNSAVLYCGNGVDCNSKLPGTVFGNLASPSFNTVSMAQLNLKGAGGSGTTSLLPSAGSIYTLVLPTSPGLTSQALDGSTNLAWGAAGVTCSGAPTASFATTTDGRVTHC